MPTTSPSILFQFATGQQEPDESLRPYTHRNGAMVISVLSPSEERSRDIAEHIQETLEFAGGHGGEHIAELFVAKARADQVFLAIRVEENGPNYTLRPIDLSETTGCHHHLEM